MGVKCKRLVVLFVSVVALFTMTGCSTGDEVSQGEAAVVESVVEKSLVAPSDFSFDPNSGEVRFAANDEQVGYYFVRVFATSGGEEADTYIASSKRITGGSTGTLTSKVDVSGIGWGTYNVRLFTFAAAGSGYTAPKEDVMLQARYGVGGKLEKPEILVMVDGSDVEFVPDWYTLSDYYSYQYLPVMSFSFYKDEALTDLVETYEVDLGSLAQTVDSHPIGGFIWGFTGTADHLYMNEGQYGFEEAIYTYTLPEGDYYVTCQAVSSDTSSFESSEPSDVLAIHVSGGERTGSFEAYTTTLWQNPEVFGIPVAVPGLHVDRVDFAGEQVTSAKIVE